jgi:hypothetical protein
LWPHGPEVSQAVWLEVLKEMIVLLRVFLSICCTIPIVFGVCVEALRISRIPHGWDDRATASTMYDVVPVDTAKEGMRLDSLSTTTDVAEAARTVDGAE